MFLPFLTSRAPSLEIKGRLYSDSESIFNGTLNAKRSYIGANQIYYSSLSEGIECILVMSETVIYESETRPLLADVVLKFERAELQMIILMFS